MSTYKYTSTNKYLGGLQVLVGYRSRIISIEQYCGFMPMAS